MPALLEYTRWLKEAGFTAVTSHADIPNAMPGTTLIVAEKK